MRVLLVEDEETLARYVRRGLAGEGHAVDIAADGVEGLWMAQEQAYDAIVLDILLPMMNGYRVCAELRARGDWTPILMLTAKLGDLDEAEALDSGADDFLRKPFSFEVLLARLRAITRRSPAERPAVLQVGDLTLDPGRRQCAVGATPIELTPLEFCILQLLTSRPGEVHSRTAILRGCWDANFDGDSNVVEVHIGHLRRKLDVHPGERIQTVRGVGYRFVPEGGS
jgi:DNA-binding response OmpR family regulator